MNDRILFVDDEQHVLDSFRTNFARRYTVLTANGSEEGLRRLKDSGPFAVVVSDLKMPGMDGLTFLDRVSKLAPETARVMLTGYADLQTALEAFNSGIVHRFLEKPCSQSELSRTIKEAVEHHHVEMSRKLESKARVLMEHDLKGPLLGITGLAARIRDAGDLPEESERMLAAIKRTGLHTLKLLDSLSAIRWIEEGSYVICPTKVDVNALAREIAGRYFPPSAKLDLNLIVSRDGVPTDTEAVLEVTADPFLLENILDTLLKNAVEASPLGEAIEFRLSISEGLRIAIRNRGEVPEVIREDFFRKYTTHGKRFGTGIGTYSAQIMTAALGGEIFLDCSEPGHTTVIVNIPV
jgi:FixJ family two-component response regulator